MLHRRLFGLLSREIRGLHQAAYLLAVLSLGSGLLGLVRDRLLAHYYGADTALDLYYAAFRVPDLLFATVCSLVSVYVLVPFIEERGAQSKDAVQQMLSQVFTVFFVVMLLVCGLAALFASELSSYLFPGFVGASHEQLVLLMRILLLQPLLLGLSNLTGAIVQAHQRFLIYALGPVLYNVGIIIGILWFTRYDELVGLAWGVVLGALLHLAVQLPYLYEARLAPRFTVVHEWMLIVRIVLVSMPRTLALSLQQLVLFALVAQATLIGAGSVAVLMFGWNLQSVPVAVVAAAYSVAAFPTLSRYHAAGDLRSFIAHASTALRHILFWSIPIFVLAAVLRAQLVRVILGSGAFDWQDTMLTAAVLALFLASLWAQGVSMLLMRAWYAAGKTWFPLCAALLAAGVTLALLFMPGVRITDSAFLGMLQHYLDVEGLVGNDVLALALAYTVGTWTSALALLFAFTRRFGELPAVRRVVGQSILSALVAGISAYVALWACSPLLSSGTVWVVLVQGLVAGVVGISVWAGMLWLLGSRELVDTVGAISARVWKRRVLVGGPDST